MALLNDLCKNHVPRGDFRTNKVKKAYKIGDKIVVFLITLYWVGELAAMDDDTITIVDATFIPVIKSLTELYESGFQIDDESLQCTGAWQELNRGAIASISPYPRDLPLPSKRVKKVAPATTEVSPATTEVSPNTPQDGGF